MFTSIPLRTAATGAEEEIILQQMRVVPPISRPFLRCGFPRLLVDNVSLLLLLLEQLVEDLHTAERLSESGKS